MKHICEYCASGWFCDCGAVNNDDSVYYDHLFNKTIKNPYNNVATRLNDAIKASQEESWHTWNKVGITTWTEWIATGRTLLRATSRKIKSRLSWRNWTGR